MALASLRVEIISRGKGRSAVASAAYRSGAKLYSEYEQKTYDYTRKKGIVYTEILAPSGAPDWCSQRQLLWTLAEAAESRKDARLAREVMMALPCELSRDQNISLARAYARTFTGQGMIADVAVHDTGEGNPHAHIMLTDRPLEGEGFSKKKNRDWNSNERLAEWREQYENLTNQYLERYGHKERIDIRSYSERGLDQIPTIHLGHYAHQLEKRGIQTDRGDINREIERANQEIAGINRELASLQKEHEQEVALKRLSVPEARPRDELPTRETERPEATKPPPLPHRHPVGRTWAQHRQAALEPGQQRDAAGRDQPPPLRRHFESRNPAQQRRMPQEPERRGPPEPSGETLSPRSRIGHNPMRRMVSPETETFAKQHKTESDKLPEKEQDHVRPTSHGGERKLGFRDLRETLKKEYEQEKEEERNHSSRDRPDQKR